MRYSNLPSQNFLRSIISYDAATGRMIWKRRPDQTKTWNTRFAGKDAGYLSPERGYITVRINCRLYSGHRVAWAIAHGGVPEGKQIDHINGNRADNRLSNLRLATNAENARNDGKARPSNKSGMRGVSFHPFSQLWRARLTKDGKEIFTAYFKTAEEARAAYMQAAQHHFGQFARMR